MFQDSRSKSAIAGSQVIGILQIVFGGLFALFFGLGLFGSFLTITDPDTGVGMVIFMMIVFGAFVYMLICGIRRLKFIGTYNYYIRLLGQGPSHSIEQLAVILRTPIQLVRKNLEKMTKKGFLAGAYIDNRTNQIVCTMYQQVVQPMPGPRPIPNIMPPVQIQRPVEYAEAICKNCGASNKIIKGSSGNCEYCGSSVK